MGDETLKNLRDARVITRLRAFEAAREGEKRVVHWDAAAMGMLYCGC